MSGPRIGARVVVRIRPGTRDHYAHGAVAVLDGQEGTIERTRADGEILVAFDPPLPPWWSNGSTVSGFWFPPGDLQSHEDESFIEGVDQLPVTCDNCLGTIDPDDADAVVPRPDERTVQSECQYCGECARAAREASE